MAVFFLSGPFSPFYNKVSITARKGSCPARHGQNADSPQKPAFFQAAKAVQIFGKPLFSPVFAIFPLTFFIRRVYNDICNNALKRPVSARFAFREEGLWLQAFPKHGYKPSWSSGVKSADGWPRYRPQSDIALLGGVIRVVPRSVRFGPDHGAGRFFFAAWKMKTKKAG